MARIIPVHKGMQNGELILPRMAADGGYSMQCCDCALVHRLDFSIFTQAGPADPREYKLELRVYRDDEATKIARERGD
jgi:hypothetical protein